VNFLNVGPMELMVILILAIMLVGPKRVVEVVQTIRRFAGQLRSLSGEFTSLIQNEVQTAERRDAPSAVVDAAGDQDATQDAVQRKGGDLQDIIREGVAPIANIQAELRATAQETRQAFENVVSKDLASIASIPAELQIEFEDAAQETRRILATPIDSEPDKGEPTDKSASGQSEQEVE
jgi:Sec-independent protein translocase protein TatA